jgi:hypothetical protein
VFLVRRGQDVRDACPNRTARTDRARQRGKSDTLDAERVAREVLAHPLLPRALKRAGDQPAGPDPRRELLGLWQRRRALGPDQSPASGQRGRVAAGRCRSSCASNSRTAPRCARGCAHSPAGACGLATPLRLRLLADHHSQITRLDAEERAVCRELAS